MVGYKVGSKWTKERCKMKFTKMHGAGNDFIIINNIEEKIPVAELPKVAEKLCHRRFSIGADGFMVVDHPEYGGDYKMRFYNDIIWIYEYKPDGLTQAGDRLFWENPQGTGIFFREKAVFFNYSLWTKLGMWYGYATENFGRCTDDQIAEYIDMPRWLVYPIRWFHTLVHIVRKMR